MYAVESFSRHFFNPNITQGLRRVHAVAETVLFEDKKIETRPEPHVR